MIETRSTYESPLVTQDLGDATPAGRRCGDLLLQFGKAEPGIPWRYDFASFQTAGAGQDWNLILQRVSETCKGYPLSAGSMNGWNVLLLGELRSTVPHGHERLSLLYDVVSGRTGAETLNGRFLLLGHDQSRRQWHWFTDRFGTFHAYYGSDGWRSAVGTFSPAVVASASRRQIDWLALQAFFAQGFFPADRTFFDDVRILQPASHYVFDEEGKIREQSRYWNWWHQPNRNRSYDETVDEFGGIFREVMQDVTRDGRVALPISGGLDSRSTAIIADNDQTITEGPDLWAYSYGYTHDSVETNIARQIASARRLPFQSFTIKPYLFQKLDLVLDSVEGFQDITQCRQASVLDEIAINADYVVAAHWGDVWMDTMGLAVGDRGANHNQSDLDEGAIVDFAVKKTRKTGSEWLLENVAEPHLKTRKGDETLADAARQEIAKLREIKCPDFRLKAFKTDNWSFRWTVASLRMFQPAAFARLPFYDTRLTDFFCTIPSEFVRGRQLQIDYLKRMAPDLAKITWQTYDANLFNYHHHNSWLLPKRAVKKARRLISRKKVVERNWEVQFSNSDGRAGLNELLLRTGLRLHSFVSPAKVGTLLQEFYADPYARKRGYTVSMLLTLSTWMERYG
jgi:asparagine synthetase B (glutamine-hydrolysing)